MRLPEACAVCGGVGSLAPYRDIARAYGWPDSQAHLDCVRYSVATVPLRSRSSFCPRGHRLIQSTDECYTVRQVGPDLYEYVRGSCDELAAQEGDSL